MVNGIAHNINNLLMGIQGNIELAALDLTEEYRADESLERAVEIIQTTKKLTKKFLVFAYFNNPHKQTTSIRDMITYAENHELSESNVSCEFSSSDNLWLVDVNPYQMSNALLDLVVFGEGVILSLYLNSDSYPTVNTLDSVLRILRKCALFLSKGQIGFAQGVKPNFL